MGDACLTVSDLGELGLLDRLFRFCPGGWVGDDAAVLSMAADRQLVVTTDVLVDGVHFSDRTTAPTDVGWRAVAANLSDLAAMGAEPLGITVGLSLPPTTRVAWIEGVYAGIGQCLNAYGGQILGGDLCRSPTVTVAITALGQVQPGQALYRSRAEPGQVILATGVHGASRAGLALLLEEVAPAIGAEQQVTWIQAHCRPKPRFDAVAQLRQLLPDNCDSTPVAAMDSSDGLANAVLQICQASGVGAQLVRSHLPIPPGLIDWVGPERAVEWALYGGEDFELVLCLAPALATALLRQLEPGAAIIGTVTPSPDILLVDTAAAPGSPLSLQAGFQHF
ncbi:hypothetical protein XM38_000690 [Halomicronema hongdechloris C2206]|uniref:Thiamine-monophosphate kinase n=1 Tax=Halomicronema hongdechloris C2206 TaxID=1641165 RepID=A0A1Z3HFT2_9CYAN|nr:thiamine-phosphate kinase [Halomicronema hongdechloris]ASC69143.1 hypothetical protein XM38_000690 [Halomicronema hongdechloris C2206]